MPNTAHCCCNISPCKYRLTETVIPCRVLTYFSGGGGYGQPAWTPALGEYTFTFDGPNGEHSVQTGGWTGWIDEPAPGVWTILVEGPAGSYTRIVTVEECKSQSNSAEDVTVGKFLGCWELSLAGEVGWEVSGPGVGSTASGTTDDDDQLRFLVYGDGDFEVDVIAPAGSLFRSHQFTLTRSSTLLVCGSLSYDWNALPNLWMPPTSVGRCWCMSKCSWPTKRNLLITTKYGTYPFDLALNTSVSFAVVAHDDEARAPSNCAPADGGFPFLSEAGSGANARVLYTVQCVDPFDPDGIKVSKQVYCFPSFSFDAYGNATHVGYRMYDPAALGWPTGFPFAADFVAGSPDVTIAPYACPVVSGSASVSSATGTFKTIPGWPQPKNCTFWAFWSPHSAPFTIPGTAETVMISEAP